MLGVTLRAAYLDLDPAGWEAVLLADALEANLLEVPGSSSSGETAAADLDLFKNLLVKPELVVPYL